MKSRSFLEGGADYVADMVAPDVPAFKNLIKAMEE